MAGPYPKKKPFSAPEPNGGGWTGAAIRGLQSLMPAGQPIGGTSQQTFYKPKSPHDFSAMVTRGSPPPANTMIGEGMQQAARHVDYPGARTQSQRWMDQQRAGHDPY